MITINDFVMQGPLDSNPRMGRVFSDWLAFTTIELRGNALQFVETRALGIRGEDEHECVEISAQPGSHLVECRGFRDNLGIRIAGMRAFAAGSNPVRGERVGEIPVDLGGVSVMDIAALQDSMDNDEERYEEWIEEILCDPDDDFLVKIHEWEPTGTKIPTVKSGFGDGVYDVYVLRDGEELVGLEIVFIIEDGE